VAHKRVPLWKAKPFAMGVRIEQTAVRISTAFNIASSTLPTVTVA
jgi:hypothetical protein